MEKIFEIIKQFLLGTVNAAIRSFNAKYQENLPLFTNENIVFGSIDPFKNPTQKMLCSIYPDSQSNESNELSYFQTISNFTLTIVNKNELYKQLLSHICAYSNIIIKSFLENYNMKTTFINSAGIEETVSVDNTEIGERTFYPDAGIAEKQAAAVEINLTIYQTEEIGD